MLALKPWTSRIGLNLFSLRRIRCSVQDFKEDKKKDFFEADNITSRWSNMTKREAYSAHLREQVARKKKRNDEPLSNRFYFQIVGNGEVDGDRGLLLITGHRNYVFNCGEGFQRSLVGKHVHRNLVQTGDLFFTSGTWKMFGGFVGMCLSMKSEGASGVKIHGPDEVMSLCDSFKSVTNLKEFNVMFQQEEKNDDSRIEVQQVPILYQPESIPNESGNLNDDIVGPIVSKGEGEIDKSFSACSSKHIFSKTVVAYLVTLSYQSGQLDINKCLELGISSGPLLKKLRAGKDISLGENILVKASDVLLEDREHRKCLIIECPNEHYLESLLNNDKLNEDIFQDDNLKIVFHFTPKSVMQTESFRKWMNGFEQGDLKHILVNDQSTGVGNDKSKRHTKKLRMIAPSIFPKIWDECADDVHEEKLPDNIVIGQSGMQYHLDSKTAISTSSEILPFNEENIVDDVKGLMGESNLLEQGHNQMVPDSSKPEYPKITFIGTGSCNPTSYRNVSSILVETKPEHFILLDCGEGSLLQLRRHVGKTRTMDILRHLKAVYISHLHPDHHLGLVNIIQQRSKLLEGVGTKKLYLITPKMYNNFLAYYSREFEPLLKHVAPIRNEHLILNYAKGSKFKTQLLYPYILEPLLKETGLKSLYTSRAVHAPSSFCVAFTTDQNFKVVYTGDTRPNRALIDIGRHEKSPDLLIHEASLQYLRQEDTVDNFHSTFADAIKDGENMGARFTILTHFSQRYAKVVPFHDFKDRPDVAVAFDHMSVNPQTFHFGQFMYPSLEKIFSKELEFIEEREEVRGSKDFEAVFRELNISV